MNDFERSAIQDSMQATLEELDIAQAALVARYMNPILLLMSVVGWGARVVREIREEQEQGGQDGDGPPPAPKDETPGPGGNGRQREPIPPEEPAAPQVIVEGIRIVPIEQLRRPAEADIFNGEGGG